MLPAFSAWAWFREHWETWLASWLLGDLLGVHSAGLDMWQADHASRPQGMTANWGCWGPVGCCLQTLGHAAGWLVLRCSIILSRTLTPKPHRAGTNTAKAIT